jgi:hypothetical protein
MANKGKGSKLLQRWSASACALAYYDACIDACMTSWYFLLRQPDDHQCLHRCLQQQQQQHHHHHHQQQQQLGC